VIFISYLNNKRNSLHLLIRSETVYFPFSKFDELVSVALRGMCVNSPGKDGEIARSIPNVEELDLSSNLLSSWEDVARISQQLPKLTSLNVS